MRAQVDSVGPASEVKVTPSLRCQLPGYARAVRMAPLSLLTWSPLRPFMIIR